jgi:hypothetical protein
MADAETTPQPLPESGAEIAVDDGEEEESKVHSTMSTIIGQHSMKNALFYRRLCS